MRLSLASSATIALRYFNPVGADPKLRSGLQVTHPTHAWGRLIAANETGGSVHDHWRRLADA